MEGALKLEAHQKCASRVRVARGAAHAVNNEIRCRDRQGSDDPPKNVADQHRSLVHYQPNVCGLNHSCRQSKQLRLCSIQAGRQLGVLHRELGIAQGSSCGGRSVSRVPNPLQNCVDGTELSLQRCAFGRLGGGDGRLELVAVRLVFRPSGFARRLERGARGLGGCIEGFQCGGNGARKVAEVRVRASHARGCSCGSPGAGWRVVAAAGQESSTKGHFGSGSDCALNGTFLVAQRGHFTIVNAGASLWKWAFVGLGRTGKWECCLPPRSNGQAPIAWQTDWTSIEAATCPGHPNATFSEIHNATQQDVGWLIYLERQ